MCQETLDCWDTAYIQRQKEINYFRKTTSTVGIISQKTVSAEKKPQSYQYKNLYANNSPNEWHQWSQKTLGAAVTQGCKKHFKRADTERCWSSSPSPASPSPRAGSPQHRHKQSVHLNFKSAVTSLTRCNGTVSEGSGGRPCSARPARAREAAREADSGASTAPQKHPVSAVFPYKAKGNSETRAPLPSPFLRYPRYNKQQKTN